MTTGTAGCTVCGRDNDHGTHAALELTGHLRHSYSPWTPPVIDVAHIDHQRVWSAATFGPGDRTEGVLDHMAKEAKEVRDAVATGKPALPEWVDLIILALDGAWRTGATSQQILTAVHAKQARNETRTWPDWRTADRDKAIEHDRSGEVSS